MQRRVFLGLVFGLLGMATHANADVMPDGLRGLKYTVSFDNLAAFPDYVFYVYPTTNAGFAYRVEPGKAITQLMVLEGRHRSPGTSLYAVKKAAFAKADAETYPHGDNNEMVQVFSPVAGAVKSNLIVGPPKDFVPRDSPKLGLTRIFHIEKVTTEGLELSVVKNELVLRDGTKTPVPYGKEVDEGAGHAGTLASAPPNATAPSAASASPAPAPSAASEPPKKRSCAIEPRGAGGSEWALAIPLVALSWLRRRVSKLSDRRLLARRT